MTYPFKMTLSGLGQEGCLGGNASSAHYPGWGRADKSLERGEQTEVRGVSSQGLSLPWAGALGHLPGPVSWLNRAEYTAPLLPQTTACHQDPGGASPGGITVPPLGVLDCNHHDYSTLPFHAIFKCSCTHPLSWNEYHQPFIGWKTDTER